MSPPTVVRASDSVTTTTDRLRAPAPVAPRTLEETGIPAELVTELLLKLLFVRGALTGADLAREAGLAYPVVDDLIADARKRQWIEVRGSFGGGPVGYQLGLSGSGKQRALQALDQSGYVGPMPVSLEEFRERVRLQSVHRLRIPRERIREALADLTLSEHVLEAIGPAVNSGRSVFLYGAPGNGKTAVASRIAGVLGDSVFMPHAIFVDGYVITVFDESAHHRAEPPEDAESPPGPRDGRWVRIERPTIVTSGELRLEDLDLRFDPASRVYRAPFQLKALGGALILDDFGRQQASPSDILSRWIMPLDYEVDHLTLHTGAKFRVPFDLLLIFASNLDPEELVDEAYLRRIQYKMEMGDPDRAHYDEIFSREAARLDFTDGVGAVDWIYRECYEARGIRPRACHPRDLLEMVADYTRYHGHEGSIPLTAEHLRFASDHYFTRGHQNGATEAAS